MKKKEFNPKNLISDNRPKFPYLGKRVKKISIFVEGLKYNFLVQANKNHSICNIVAIDHNTNTLNKVSEALSKFQGRQYDNADTIYQLENYLMSLI